MQIHSKSIQGRETICEMCGRKIEANKRGRPRKFCSDCRKQKQSDYYVRWYEENGRPDRSEPASEEAKQKFRSRAIAWAKANPEKKYAQAQVYQALRNGMISKNYNCEHCGIYYPQIVAHHPDYSRPLDVVWLCDKCHREVHSKKLPGG